MFYFAYGSNMSVSTMRRVAPFARKIGPASLADYRLRFSRRSVRSGTGVADVVAAPGFTVIGVLYEVDQDGWSNLEAKEGVHANPPAYTETGVEVYSHEEQCHRRARTFTVADPEPVEIVPSNAYMDGIIEAASRLLDGSPQPPENLARIYREYVNFLKWLKDHARARDEGGQFSRSGLLVRATKDRSKAAGQYLVRVNPATAPRGRSVSVTFGRRTVGARLERTPTVPVGVCELDQNIRSSFGILGLRNFGYTVELGNGPRNGLLVAAIRPRSTYLATRSPNWGDTEKKI
ncbi:MAG: gamma-glutamylcyclotransferase, partial [Frankia sp.]|nr:gamma-glutamylcyclotransferase [Frankia sp.]